MDGGRWSGNTLERPRGRDALRGNPEPGAVEGAVYVVPSSSSVILQPRGVWAEGGRCGWPVSTRDVEPQGDGAIRPAVPELTS